MSKKAKIYTYTVIHIGSVEHSKRVPYLMAVVEDEQSRFLTRVEGYSKDQVIQIGMEVEFLKNNENGKSIYSLIKE
ncbi:OB-fold domain-containing protein [Bacillaceae bacterium IKA-2]|nr:OB-fold domain-containing protein [Bacillaceae bacterium IKA-2]